MILIAGIGAIGSYLTLFLARPEYELLLWDDDRVEEENIATSAFMEHHVGGYKAIIASEMAAGKGCAAQYRTSTLEYLGELSDSELDSIQLLVDCFDNAPSRRKLTGFMAIPTIHIGVSEENSGSVIWDDCYQLPEDGYERGFNPVCTHDLNRRVLRMVADAAAGVVEDFIESGIKRNVSLTPRKVADV